MTTAFKNASPIDFTVKAQRDKFAETLSNYVAAQTKPHVVEPIINGESYATENFLVLGTPNDPEEKFSKVYFADQAITELALNELSKNVFAWRHEYTLAQRAAVLRSAAQSMQEQQYLLSVMIVLESGKSWFEADRDVIEAIDFCNYYACLAETSLASFATSALPGETNNYYYESYGIAAVIAPWNFPLAIACGMLTAALVSGNTAVLKPAEQSSVIAQKLIEILLAAGLPPGVVALLPGTGEQVGRALVESPSVNLICFTGSLQVGKEILQSTSKIGSADRWFKQTILELGGKNAMIIDDDAELDSAIKGIINSAYAFSGQKCSALSRLIVLDDIYDELIKRLVPAINELIVGPSTDSASFVTPLIDSSAQQTVLGFMSQADSELKLLAKSETFAPGCFVPAALYELTDPEHPLWQQEIFGPLLLVTRVSSFAAAVELTNQSSYALTAGLYSRSPDNIAYARARVRVGNLYINRTCTGAVVGRQPFGGFKLSGIGSKAGGPDYLKQFVVPKVISENTIRRGFAPDLID